MTSYYAPQAYKTRGKKTKLSMKIKGRQRDNPIQYQALINSSADMTSDQPNRSRNNEETWAPYSENAETYRVQRGEWALARVGGFDNRESRKTGEIGLNVSVFTNTNGLRKSDSIRVIGVIENPSRGHGTSKTYTNAGSVRWGGTATAINTGPHEIHVGDRVYLSLEPFSMIHEGQVVPAIDYDTSKLKDDGVGIPGDKFYPTTIVFNAGTALQAFDHLRRDLRRVIATAARSNGVKGFRDVIEGVLNLGNLKRDMPLYQAAQLIAAKMAVHFLEFDDSSNQADADRLLTSTVAPACVQAYNDYLDQVIVTKQRWERSLQDAGQSK